MLREDNTGFVVFPNNGRIFDHIDSGKTMIYLVAFDPSDLSNQPYELSKNKITLPGNFVSDDVSFVKRKQPDFLLELDDFIKEHLKDDDFSKRYFPNKELSIPLTSSILVGWFEQTIETKSGEQWFATFRDLTNEGQKLYYSMKKLHNNKEIRILTFNNI